MKQILSYHQPVTGKLQQMVCLLTDRESDKFEKSHGSSVKIDIEFKKCQPAPFKIEGKGWIMNNYSAEIIYIRKSTYKTEIYEKD